MAGVSFATASEYRLAYETDLSDEKLQAALDRASRFIAAELRAAHIDYETADAAFLADLQDVALSVTRRSLPDPQSTAPFGATSYNQGANGFTEGWSMGNPYGDLFLKAQERSRLGIATSRIGFIPLGRS